ncbi:protein of unknown function [Burkholderia multivorans]
MVSGKGRGGEDGDSLGEAVFGGPRRVLRVTGRKPSRDEAREGSARARGHRLYVGGDAFGCRCRLPLARISRCCRAARKRRSYDTVFRRSVS